MMTGIASGREAQAGFWPHPARRQGLGNIELRSGQEIRAIQVAEGRCDAFEVAIPEPGGKIPIPLVHGDEEHLDDR